MIDLLWLGLDLCAALASLIVRFLTMGWVGQDQ